MMEREQRINKVERMGPRYVVWCNGCDFSFQTGGITMVDKVSAQDICNRHATLNPTHDVYYGKLSKKV